MTLPAQAESERELDAHEHGVGELNIAIDGTTVLIELTAPGADIVGFEYDAKTEQDLAAIEDAIALLAKPLDLIEFPQAAGCALTKASAGLESDHEDEHVENDHDHAHDHDHEEHSENDSDEVSHTEFRAEYSMDCAAPDAIDRIDFTYFDVFSGARELEVQMITSSGAKKFEVVRDDPVLKLRGSI